MPIQTIDRGTAGDTGDKFKPGVAFDICQANDNFLDAKIDTLDADLVVDLALKANIASPALTGNPTAPTPSVGDNDTSIATTAFVATALNTLYPRSAVEISSGITPADYTIPSNTVGVIFPSRYTTYANSVTVADAAGLPHVGTGAGNISTNVALGRGALRSNTTGSLNIAIGRSALAISTTGDNNVAIGYDTLSAYVGASGSLTGQNTVVGSNSSVAVTTGGNNTIVGNNTFLQSTTGSYNTGIGQGSLAYQSTAIDYSVAVGYHSLLRNAGTGNTAVGAAALGDTAGSVPMTGIANTAVGYFALASSVSGDSNTALGYQAAQLGTTFSEVTAIGHGALYANTATGNTAVGKAALTANTSGTGNTAVGRKALLTNITGTENTAVGENALLVSTGPGSVAVGKNALQTLISAGNCTGVGHSALGLATGTANTAAGYEAGLTVTTGDSNTLIGFRADTIAASANSTSLGNTATSTASNQFTLGNASIATLRCQQTTITALSDRRDKKDIEDLDLGLDFINAVKVRKYVWDKRDGELSGHQEAGIIAQELQDLQSDFNAEWLNMVLDVNPERLEASPFKMFFPLIKAVQELSKKVEELEDKINTSK